MQMMKKTDRIFSISVLILLAVYLLVFAYLNLSCFADNVDSDIASEALLARRIADAHTLTPDDWYGSTQRYVFGMPSVAGFFCLLTGSLSASVGITCILLSALFLTVFYLFLKKCKVTSAASILALLMICALPVNGVRNEGQIVPFMALSFFLFADYYVLFFISFFLNLLIYLFVRGNIDMKIMKKGKMICGLNLSAWIFWILSLLYFILICLGSEHGLLFVAAPFLGYEIISLLYESNLMRKMISKKRLFGTAYVVTLILSFGVTRLYGGAQTYPTYMNNAGEFVKRAVIDVPAAILEGFGIAGNAVLGSAGSLMQLLMIAFLILTFMSLISHARILFSPEAAPDEKPVIPAVGIPFAGLVITWFVVSITSAEPAHNYFLLAWITAVVSVSFYADRLRKEGSYFSYVIVSAVIVFALLNLGYTYKKAIDSEDNLKDYKQIVSAMEDNGFEYGYAEFWDANRITILSDEKITMGTTYSIGNLEMYPWLTSEKWYPPNLPTQMHTAYVVRREKEDIFLSQFEDPSCVEKLFENDGFILYGSETNYVGLPW